MFMIHDIGTGNLYDSRVQNTMNVLDQEEEKLTKLKTIDKNPWQKWWTEKHKRNNQLLMAAEEGLLEKVQESLDKKQSEFIADINAKGMDDFTSLHFAANEGHLKVAEELIKQGASIDPLTSELWTPLHLACNKGNAEMVRLLASHYADINARNKDGNTPLHILAKGAWNEALLCLLRWQPSTAIKNVYGETPIELAANVVIRELLTTFIEDRKPEKKKDELGTYSRVVVKNMIFHNNRADMIKSLLFKEQQVATEKPHPEKSELQENKKHAPNELQNSSSDSTKNTKSRRSKIIEAAKEISKIDMEKLRQSLSVSNELSLKDLEKNINLEYFNIIKLLGKGSFGEVYLVRFKPTGKPYAMKVLDKKLFVVQNIVKYAFSERHAMASSKSPFIVRLAFAFQTSDKLFLIMDYCPG